MSTTGYKKHGTIEEFFFLQDYSIVVGGAAIVLLSNLMWVLVALKSGDPYHRLSSSAGYFMYIMIALSIAMIIAQVLAKKSIVNHRCGTEEQKRIKCRRMRFFVLTYYVLLICSVASIAIANNNLVAMTSKALPGMTVSLSAVLLFVIAFSPSSHFIDGVILLAFVVAGVILPCASANGDYFAFIPETMLRCGMIASYCVMYVRTKDRYEKQVQIEESAAAIREQEYRIVEMNDEIVDLLANTVELRDLESGEHVKRIKGFCRILSYCLMKKHPELGLTMEMVETIVRASALHDVGKIMIPDSILLKPGRLTNEEFDLMKKHTTYGYDILMSAPRSWDSKFLSYCTDIALYHHEKYDGRGYPKGLKGDEIPISAQIVSVVDCYDALISERHYKPAYSLEEAFQMIKHGECGAFSDVIMDCFEDCKEKLEAIAKKNMK